ncbi:MAG TPA: carboxymuconolactone decarboxylase family protein [Candidatus Bathyarchaeia archaeon]|nr:carboxymuconolactone decarboxylase family protein [Candidatus Bathyarchaeia archaeon]
MARLPYVDADDPAADPEARDLLRAMKLAGGDVNLLKAMANHPAILRGFMGFAGPAYFTSSLPSALRELAYLTATAVNRCHY